MTKSFTLLAILFTMTLSAQQLSQHRWQNRLLVLVGSSESAVTLQQQMAILTADEDGLKDRKLLIYQFKNRDYNLGLSAAKKWQKGAVPTFLSSEISDDTPYTIFLIGLDGGIKMQQENLVAIKDIFNLIDQMPMRRSELNRSNPYP